MQNYEKVKQAMLVGQDSAKSIFMSTFSQAGAKAAINPGIKNFMT
jgi:hypothetical protein